MKKLIALVLLLVVVVPHTPAQTTADAGLLDAISKIKAVDNHAP
ncbi:MAG TPA: hypothetical protein VGN90_05410 [Pyrinomonadaceae bacterium]|jgi:hypothetical protein|nr:hypothetical protein [Pyrinomonadaceae bacterium]